MNLPCALSFTAASGMSASYTDRISSFMHFHSDVSKKSYGLIHGDTELLKDFCFIDNSNNLITRSSCIKMTARCGSLEFVFQSFSLFITLLFTGEISPSLCIRYVPKASNKNFPVPKKLILLTGSAVVCSNTDDEAEKNVRNKISSTHTNMLVIPVEASAENRWTVLFKIKSENEFHVVNKNYLSSLMHNHRIQIEQFFSNISFSISSENAQENTDNKIYSASLLWAFFSGWMLVTGIKDRGIWAGLPWFRDNWGRDTFIALPGILLVSGQFEEARSVIEAFARYQNTDSTSASYGKIPNRYRSESDVIYNTADGTLWFIRELWEYVQYTADINFLKKMFPIVQRALEADRTLRCDANDFLLHDDADTWMDARIENKEPWSPRGNRACDIQALWYTALQIGASMASICGSSNDEVIWRNTAQAVKKNFSLVFISSETPFIADCIHADGQEDMRVRPNQLLCTTVSNITGFKEDEAKFISDSIMEKSVHTVFEKLAFPYGLTSLNQNHENFHPYHDSCEMYHKDAAYHNGTIWLWNSGPLVESMCLLHEQDAVYALSLSHAKLMQPSYTAAYTGGCAGSLSENMDAYLTDGSEHLSGTFSQAWSVSEFTRTAYTSYVGIRPCLIDNRIIISPSFPLSWKKGHISFRAGEELFTLSWRTHGETEEVYFTLSRRSTHTRNLHSLEVWVHLAEKKGSAVHTQYYLLQPEDSSSFSGFIPKSSVKSSFAIPENNDEHKKTIPSINEENYLYKKIKGRNYE